MERDRRYFLVTRGRFITFEGGEGAGKSTQARLLASRLRDAGIETIETREPGGTAGAEAIRGLLLDPAGEGWNMPAEALLFAAARADHVARLIEPALAACKWIVCDRFIDSTRAYQGEALDDRDIMALHRIGSGGILPDRTILLRVDGGESERRVRARDGDAGDRIGNRSSSYHRAVHARFAKFAASEPTRFVTVDGSAPPNAVHEAVWAAIEPLVRTR